MSDKELEPAAAELLNALADGAIVVRDAKIVFANPRAAELFGYGGSSLVGQTIEALVPESERDTHASVRAGYESEPSARIMGARRGLMGRREDGTYFRVDVSLSPIETPGGRAVLALVRDITDRLPD